ncbi:ribonuclease P protein component [Chitinophagaceae bacterium LB-8]|uniref:Ribonuclease P protein component n=1 Tax=Paraflavisolibacter caeni TaxID=2982496 RepID=A0A9X2XVU4_9BACT|nr:ribonuclease P protein component [Paraflavisolibacter caeni]MCU7548613.1 ribonuclease P protein component [Paraflavisolibacter caeni]
MNSSGNGAILLYTKMAKKFALGKEEKLKSRKQIESLFANGKTFMCFPLRISYALSPPAEGEKSGMQIGVSASKRYFKRAVDRNRIKRLMREAYRLQKKEIATFLQTNQLKGHVFFIYIDKSLPTYSTVFEAMTKCLKLLQKKAEKSNEKTS